MRRNASPGSVIAANRTGVSIALRRPVAYKAFMARNQPVYVCSSFGGEALKWQGQCPHCSEWNTLSRVLGVRPLTAVHGSPSPAGITLALMTETPRGEQISLGMS